MNAWNLFGLWLGGVGTGIGLTLFVLSIIGKFAQ